MTYVRSVIPMRTAKIGNIALAAALIAAGIGLLVKPDVSTALVGDLVGIVLTLSGVFRLIGYFSKDLYRLAFQFDLIYGIVLIVLGIVTLTKPQNLLHVLSIAAGICVIADGLMKLRIAADSRRFGIRNSWLIAGTAVLTLALGLLLVFCPAESVRLLTRCLGLVLLAEGVLNLITVIMTVKITKNQKPDLIEATFTEGE
ncbi:MAG: DUF308 domain-containing protein [Oscillospiraceae bacterium]|nr:DUF308 domain-containing protein [Oscillospiraceae bacterium]